MTPAARRALAAPVTVAVAVTVAVLSAVSLPPVAAAQEELTKSERLERLRPEHRDWLEKEVTYIITDREEEVFLSLETLEERNRFIEVFWQKRDPHPATLENEFRDEHYARLEYANKFLGRETFREGWRTDRGRYYIMLGEPRERHSFDGYNEVVSSELWFYQGDVRLGLPSFFYLLFFKRHDIGEYRIYHPIVDGPGSLVRGQYAQASTPEGNIQAYEALQRVDVELANASLSFDPSEPGDWTTGRASMATDLLMARVEDSPRRAIRSDYADAWLRYRDRVSTEYSFNFVESRGIFGITGGPQDTPFVHFTVEIDPQNFTLETDEDQTRFYTTLDISVEAVNEDEVTVLTVDRPAFLELTRSQVDQVRSSPFAYQDSVPLLPGVYEVSVVVRNRAAQQFTVFEETLDLSDAALGGAGADARLVDVIPGFDSNLLVDAPTEDAVRTFQIGSVEVKPAAGGVFALGDTLHAFAPVLGAEPGQVVRFRILNEDAGNPGDRVLSEAEEPARGTGAVVARLPLDVGVGGNYWLAAQLEDETGAVLDRRERRIQVSPRAGVPRSGFVYRRGFNAEVPGLLPMVRGDQFLALSRFEEALAEYEAAVAADNALKLNGGTIRDEGNNDAALGLGSHSITDGDIVIDGDGADVRAPSVAGVSVSRSAQDASGAFITGDDVVVTVEFDEAVTVTGTPQMTLTVGAATRRAAYASGSETTSLVFRYTVEGMDGDANESSIRALALALNGGTIRDRAANDATLDFGRHGVSESGDLMVNGSTANTTAPIVTGVSLSGNGHGANGTFVAGDVVAVVVEFSEPVTVAGTPQVALTIEDATRQANYVSGSGTSSLAFRYTVRSGDNDTNGISIGFQLPAARWKLAHGYLQTGRVPEAAALLEPMEEAAPDSHEVATGLGFVRFFQNRFDESVEHLERAIGLRAPVPTVLNVLAEAYDRTGRPEDARATFERSLELNADQPQVRERLAALGATPDPGH